MVLENKVKRILRKENLIPDLLLKGVQSGSPIFRGGLPSIVLSSKAEHLKRVLGKINILKINFLTREKRPFPCSLWPLNEAKKITFKYSIALYSICVFNTTHKRIPQDWVVHKRIDLQITKIPLNPSTQQQCLYTCEMTYVQVSIETLFIMAEDWKQTKCPLVWSG